MAAVRVSAVGRKLPPVTRMAFWLKPKSRVLDRKGVPFPSRKAADLNLNQGMPTILACIRDREIKEAIAILETLVAHVPNNRIKLDPC